jgi:hypothetical protein
VGIGIVLGIPPVLPVAGASLAPGRRMTTTPRTAPLIQGLFYVTTGLWPIVHLRSFEAVTGPKYDKWLARTLGGLVTAVGAALIAGAFELRPSRSLRLLGIGSAVALGLADVVYAARGRISKVYLGDALAEGALAASWAITN